MPNPFLDFLTRDLGPSDVLATNQFDGGWMGAIAVGMILVKWIIRLYQQCRCSNAAILQVRQYSETETIDTQTGLQQAEINSRSLYENAIEGIFQITPQGCYISANPTLARMQGYDSPQEMVASVTNIGNQRYVVGDRWAEFADLMEQQGIVKEFISQVYCKNGSTIWVSENGQAVRNEAGTLLYYAGTSLDITDRKQAEIALEEYEERIQALYEQAKLGMNLTDASGRYIQVNQAYCNLVGYTEAELLGGMTFYDLTYADDQPSDRNLQQQIWTNEIQIYRLEKRCIRKDGRIIWIKLHCSQVYSIDGTLEYVASIVEDVSDRKQAEEALRQSEEQFRAIFEQSEIGMNLVDTCGRFILVNQALCNLVGYSKDELLEMTYYDLTYPEDIEVEWSLAKQLLTNEIQTYSLEKRYIRKDGLIKWVNVHIFQVHASDGSVVFSTALVEDISDRKQAEAALLHSEATNRAIVSAIPDLLIWMKQDGTYLNIVKGGNVKILGGDQLARGVRIHDIMPPATVQQRMGYIQQALATGELQIYDYQLEIDGDVRDEEARIVVVDADEVLVMVRDITNRKQTERMLSELYHQIQQLNAHLEQQVQDRTAELQQALTFEALLKRITDKVRDSLDENQILQTAVDELGTGLQIQCCNAAIYSDDLTAHTITHEYTHSQPFALGQTILFSNCPTIKIFDQLIAGQYSQFCLMVDTYAQPSERFFAILACPMFDDQEVLGDLWLYKEKHSSFNHLEIRLVQQVANQCAIALRQSRLYQASQSQVEELELERLNHLKDDFLSTVSHELRTPMSNIKMATQMLEIGMEQMGLLDTEDEGEGKGDSDRVTRYLQILKDECYRETNLINDLLDLSRLDSGTEPLIASTLNLQYWIPHIAEVFTERTRGCQQALELKIPDDLPAFTTDFTYLELVLTELLHNACKYTPAGGQIVVAVQVLSPLSPLPSPLCFFLPHPSSLLITICNSGIEIPPDELSHVFDKFYRVPNNDPWKHGGTGLGLALVKKRVERLQGEIEVTSEQNWTSFTIQLPWNLG